MTRRAQNLSTSLPSHFRYCPVASPTYRTSPFFNPNPEHDDPARCPVPAVDSASAQTRLEALNGWEVSFTVLSLYASSTVALIYVLFALHRAVDSWRFHHVITQLTTLDVIIRSLLEFASVALPLYFVMNLMLTPRLTDEQIWTCALLTVGLLATNPLTRDDLTLIQPRRIIVTDAVYTATVYLYLLMAAHSYRIVNARRIHSVSFYAPKFAIAFSYVIVKLIVGFYARVSLGLIPFSRILTWLTLVRAHRATFRITGPVLLTACMDTAFAFWLVKEVTTTSEFLATVSYVEYRTKQLGFRCFVYQTLAFCFNIIALALLINVSLPSSYLFYLCDNPSDFVVLEPPVARLGLALVYFTWTLVLAYVNLPPTPLLLPAVRNLANRLLQSVSNSRFAIWLGLVDVVSTAEAEDSCDEDVSNGLSQPCSTHPITELRPLPIPMRYRHRELYDIIPLTPKPTRFLNVQQSFQRCDGHHDMSPSLMTSIVTPVATASPSLPKGIEEGVQVDGDHDVSGHDHLAFSPLPPPAVVRTLEPDTKSFPIAIPTSPSAIRSSPIAIPTSPIAIPTSPIAVPQQRHHTREDVILKMDENEVCRRRLRLRKNLFVMETQVLMVNAAYLSYIFGNPQEERPRRQAPSMGAANAETSGIRDRMLIDFDDTDDGSDLCSNGTINENKQEDGADGPEETQPEHDDESMFRVDPYEMAERYGYKVFKYITCESWNTHAVVLVGENRVVVAFSGTRDASNWRVNANINRAVLDDKLTRFEYEFGDGDDDVGVVGESHDLDLSFDGFEMGDASHHDVRRGSVQRSLSDCDVLCRRSGYEASAGLEDTPPAESKSYGAVGSGMAVRRTVSEWLPTHRGEDRPDDQESGVWRTQSGMTMVASAFAHELMTFGKPKVHLGFLEAYMSIRKRVLGALLQLYGGQNGKGAAEALPLFFVGHSLGGAMSTFGCYEAARYFKRIGIARRQDISCTTFGCPRVGNEAFKMRYERLVETHWRFEMAADPIPKMPTVVLNYVPVGVQVLMDRSGMLLIDPSFIEMQWWGRLSNFYLGYRMHIRATYCMALRMYCKLYKHGTDDLDDHFWPFPVRVQTRGLFRHFQFDDG